MTLLIQEVRWGGEGSGMSLLYSGQMGDQLKRDHNNDNEGGLEFDCEDVEVLEITVVVLVLKKKIVGTSH